MGLRPLHIAKGWCVLHFAIAGDPKKKLPIQTQRAVLEWLLEDVNRMKSCGLHVEMASKIRSDVFKKTV